MSTAHMSWWSSSVSASQSASAGSDADAGPLTLLASGNREALTEIYRRHAQPVFRFAWHLTASREAAEEITQETFLVLLRDPGKYDAARGSLAGWLLGIARQLARKHWKAPVSVSLDEETETDLAVSTEEGALERLIAGEDWERLQRAIAMLPEAFREALVLHHLHGLSYEEAARILECPIGTVRSRIARAREMLVRRLTKEVPGAPAEGVDADGRKGGNRYVAG